MVNCSSKNSSNTDIVARDVSSSNNAYKSYQRCYDNLELDELKKIYKIVFRASMTNSSSNIRSHLAILKSAITGKLVIRIKERRNERNRGYSLNNNDYKTLENELNDIMRELERRAPSIPPPPPPPPSMRPRSGGRRTRRSRTRRSRTRRSRK